MYVVGVKSYCLVFDVSAFVSFSSGTAREGVVKTQTCIGKSQARTGTYSDTFFMNVTTCALHTYIHLLTELQEKADVLSQLRALEREDRVHRQKSLAKMPVSIC